MISKLHIRNSRLSMQPPHAWLPTVIMPPTGLVTNGERVACVNIIVSSQCIAGGARRAAHIVLGGQAVDFGGVHADVVGISTCIQRLGKGGTGIARIVICAR